MALGVPWGPLGLPRGLLGGPCQKHTKQEGLAEVIHEHQAKGGLAMIATHMDLDVEGAQTLNLEPFARAQ